MLWFGTLSPGTPSLSVGGLWSCLTGSLSYFRKESHSFTFHLPQENFCGLQQSCGYLSMHRRRIAPGLILSTVHSFSISEEVQETLQAEGGAGRSWQELVIHSQMVGTAKPGQAGTCAWISKKQRNLGAIWAGLRKSKLIVISMSKHRYERNWIQKLKFQICAVTEKCGGKNHRFSAAVHFDNTFAKCCGGFSLVCLGLYVYGTFQTPKTAVALCAPRATQPHQPALAPQVTCVPQRLSFTVTQ